MRKGHGKSSQRQAFLSQFLLCLQGCGLAQHGHDEPSSISKIFLTYYLSSVRRPLIPLGYPLTPFPGGKGFWK